MLPLFEPGAIALLATAAAAARDGRGDGRPGAPALSRRALKPGEPLSRGELVERLRSRGIELTMQTRMHLFRLAVSEDVACFGPDAGGEPCLVARRHGLASGRGTIAPGLWPSWRGGTSRPSGRRRRRTTPGGRGWRCATSASALEAIGERAAGVRRVERDGGLDAGGAAAPVATRSCGSCPAGTPTRWAIAIASSWRPPRHWKRVLPGGGVIKPTVRRRWAGGRALALGAEGRPVEGRASSRSRSSSAATRQRGRGRGRRPRPLRGRSVTPTATSYAAYAAYSYSLARRPGAGSTGRSGPAAGPPRSRSGSGTRSAPGGRRASSSCSSFQPTSRASSTRCVVGRPSASSEPSRKASRAASRSIGRLEAPGAARSRRGRGPRAARS